MSADARPLISVVMPNYNKGPYVAEAVHSVLSQTLTDLELLVVDDASTDSSPSQLAELAGTDPRMKFLSHSVRRGPSAARNTAIRAASGTYISHIDSDDVYSTGWLHSAFEALAGAGPTVAYSDWWVMGRSGSRIRSSRPHPRKSGFILPDFLLQSLEVNAGIIAPRDCFFDTGLYDESMAWGEDYDMVLRLAARYPFAYVDQESYGYRLHPGNSWKQFPRSEMYAHKASTLEKHLGLVGQLLPQQARDEVARRIIQYRALSEDTPGLRSHFSLNAKLAALLK